MTTSAYYDFDLQIEKEADGYQAQVIDSPAGQVSSQFKLPFTDLELENFYLRVGRPRQGVRRIDSPEMESVKKVGGSLFEAVFSEDVLSLLNSSQAIARSQGKRLRIRLRFNTPEVGDLPWEFLYNARQNRFLALSQETPVVRYLEIPQPDEPLSIDLPLKVIVMVSSPTDYPALDVEAEYARLAAALQPLRSKGLVSLSRIDDASLETLQVQMRQGKFHIFHFIGHGGFDPGTQEGLLVFEDQNNLGKRLTGQELGWLLHNYPSMRLVVLNACEGARSGSQDPFAGVAQSLVQQGIPAVIAMQFEITDQAALSFSQNFYASLANGDPVDSALSEARMSIFTSGNDIEWGTPVLFTRSSDGHLFDIPSAPTTRKVVEPSPLPLPVAKKPAPAVLPAKKPSPSPAQQSFLKRLPVWVWFLVSLCLLGFVASGICLATVFYQMGQNDKVITQLPPALTVVSVQGTPVEPALTATSTQSPEPTKTLIVAASLPTDTLAPENTPTEAGGSTILFTDSVGVSMSLVPAGTFIYGSQNGDADEQPSHTIYLDAFYIDQYEVTNARYKYCVLAGVCPWPQSNISNSRNVYYESPLFQDYPVIYIDWSSAETYCEWRGARLPTEAEWEKAGRGVDGRTYPWGEGASCALENLVNCVGDTSQVGSYPGSASPYSVFDMSGNVWEWTADWYEADYYATLTDNTRNPQGPESGTSRVIRGGSWADAAYQTRLTQRFQFDPQAVDNALGFRCARSP
jgi:formylglycine-generating enzyme required for sulfatase activity